MLNNAYLSIKLFLSFTLHETEVPPKNSDSDFSFVVSFRTFSCNTCKCPVISLVHRLTVEILLTIISPCSVQVQGVLRNSTMIEVLGVLNKVLYREAPPRGTTPYPFIHHFDRKVTYPFLRRGFHCHAIKNKNVNLLIQKVQNLGNERR